MSNVLSPRPIASIRPNLIAAFYTVLVVLPLTISCEALPTRPDYYPEPMIQKIPYMVRIENQYGIFRGTGFVVSRKGLVLTVSHVVRYNSPIRAILNGKVYMAKTVFDDPVLDMTLIRLPLDGQSLEIQIPCFWVSDSTRSGDTVIVLGERQQGGVVVIPAYMVSWASFHIWPGFYRDVMRIYPANPRNSPKPGFSGGPIFNIQKYVIGLFCCFESLIDRYYNGIPSSRIISKLKETEWLKEMCTVSENQPYPLPGLTYDIKRVSSEKALPVYP